MGAASNFWRSTMKKTAFTLIELLIVIAIIGLLATMAMVSLKEVRARTRDAKRLSDVKQILTALQLHFDKYERYPGSVWSYGECESACGCWDTSPVDNDGDGKPFIEPLVDEGLMQPVPGDPINKGLCHDYAYRYYRYNAGSYGCNPHLGAFFVLGINNLETSSRPHPQSPGWTCPTRNWQTEFDWVTGGFER